MPITLADAKKLTQDKLTQEVIDEFRQSAILDALPFDNTVIPNGETLVYSWNQVKTQPTAAGRAINSEYVPQETNTELKSTELKVFGGSYQVDRVIQQHVKKVVDHIDFQSKQKAKASIALFHEAFIYGDITTKPLLFDGINKHVTGSSTDYTNATLIDLSDANKVKENGHAFMYALRQLKKNMDGITHILMNADAYAVLQSVADFLPNIRYDKNALGEEVLFYGTAQFVEIGDKQGTADPIIPTAADGKTDIFAVRLGMDGVHGVAPEGELVKLYLPNLTAPGAVKTGEVELIASIAVKKTRSVGALRGIKVIAVEDEEDPEA